MSVPETFPATHGELYDQLREMFGIGSYDDSQDEAWHRARMVEVMKLKGLCRRRHASVQQVAIAAWFAKENGFPVQHSVQLYPLIPQAMRAYNAEMQASAREAEDHELQRAVNTAMRLGEEEWAGRLLRATGRDRRKVLDEWEATL